MAKKKKSLYRFDKTVRKQPVSRSGTKPKQGMIFLPRELIGKHVKVVVEVKA